MGTFDTVSVRSSDASVAQPRQDQEPVASAYQAPELFALGTMTELVQGFSGRYYDGGGRSDFTAF